MFAATTQVVTVEAFDRLDLPENRNWELHDGEVVETTFQLFVRFDQSKKIIAR